MNRIIQRCLTGSALTATVLLFAAQVQAADVENIAVVERPREALAAAQIGAGAVAAERRVTINFVNTDVVDVLRALSMQTGSNIVAGPEVQGNVSITLRDVPLDEALDLVTSLNNLAYQRMNGTYVVSTPARLKELYPGSSATHVYTLTSLSPEAAVTSLQRLVPGVVAQPQGTSIVSITGTQQEVESARSLLAQMEGAGQAVTGVRQTEVYFLRHLNPLEATRMLASLVPEVLVVVGPGKRLPGTGSVSSVAAGTREVTTVATPGGTALTQDRPATPGAELGEVRVDLNPGEEPRELLLTGYPAALARAVELLQRVDVAPRQVEINARLVDLAVRDAQSLGLQYEFGSLSLLEGDRAGDPLGVEPRPRPWQFGRFFRVPFNIGIQLDALSQTGDTRMLANPRVAAVDGRTARIFIGDTITYVVARLQGGLGGETITTEKLNAGISLLVTPSLSPDGTIIMEVHPSVSAITEWRQLAPGVVLPQVAERSVSTTIRMQDGETIAIGGLLREDEIRTMTSVPFLSRIPILGELFKHRQTSRVRSDVTLFLTANILD